MAISTSSIFHSTNNIAILKNILQNGFKITYCLEKYELGSSKVNAGIAMVSFADIPLSQMKYGVSNYGSYSIGLSKEWASINSINPVLYMETESRLSYIFEKFIKHILSIPNWDKTFELKINEKGETIVSRVHNKDVELLIQVHYGLISFVKNSKGDLIRKDKKVIPNFNFYAEREWRYVPSEQDLIDNQFSTEIVITENIFTKWRDKSQKKEFFPRIALTFGSNDITHIIVKKDSEINNLINYLRKNANFNNNQHDFELLISKITSYERLNNDF